MRIYIALLLIFVSFTSAQAQWLTRSRIPNLPNVDKAPLTWGYYFGLNSLDYNFDYKNSNREVQIEKQFGFNVGLVGNLRISEFISIRTEPGLVYTQRDLMYEPDPRFDQESDLIREVPATYIYLPLMVRFNARRLNNFRPHISAGIATAANLSSNEDNPDDNFAGQFRTKSSPLFYELGIGVDLYLYYFKFTPTLKAVFATTNELVPDNRDNSPWTGNINSIQTRGVFINLTFQ